jgi:hypothetical protein
MTQPIVFISHFRIKEGALDAYMELQRTATAGLEADKPQTLVFLAYLDDRGERLTIVHGFADADAMDLHFQGAEERSARAYEVLIPDGWEIYGSPSEGALESIRSSAAASGVGFIHQPDFVAGFLRVASS